MNNPILNADPKGDTVGVLYFKGWVPMKAYFKGRELYDMQTHKIADLSKDYSNAAPMDLLYLQILEKSVDPELQKRFNTLLNSPRHHIICRINDYNGNKVEPIDGIAETAGKPTGSTIAFDPFNLESPEDDKNLPVYRHPIIGLVHELLGHSYFDDLGKTALGKTNNVYDYEIQGVNAENYQRRAMGEDYRRSYLKQPIIKPEIDDQPIWWLRPIKIQLYPIAPYKKP